MKYDTIIIGAGLSGLATGIRLAYYDQKVCLLERHTTIGGLNSFYRLRGRNYDVGLHAVTNYGSQNVRTGPLSRVLRQLRLRWEDFGIAPQNESAVRFPDMELRFTNDPSLLENEIATNFPQQIDNYRQLVGLLTTYDALDQAAYEQSTRARLAEIFSDPLLIEMLLCPLMWYGNPREVDMDWGQFCIMFRSIYLEGFGRPLEGVRRILKHLVRQFKSEGGELRLRAGVSKIENDGRSVQKVILDDGTELEADNIVSSAGWPETQRLCGAQPDDKRDQPGRMSFVETLAVLDKPPAELGFDRTIVFFNDSPQFHWQRPETELCDLRTGVICSPNNFQYGEDVSTVGELDDGMMRTTVIADFDRWTSLDNDTYYAEKDRWLQQVFDISVPHSCDYRPHVIDTDAFTPRTIKHFTGHDNGTVYGAPYKRLDGRSHLENLHICGTDQGFLGIVGAMVSGVTIANHLLR